MLVWVQAGFAAVFGTHSGLGRSVVRGGLELNALPSGIQRNRCILRLG